MGNGKVMYSVEFPIRCSPTILYEFLAAPVGLQEWFADKVDQRDHKYHFTWNGNTETALVVAEMENEYIRYRWENGNAAEFFEFRIEQSQVTGETLLLITDFADKNDIKDQEQLWKTQVSELKHRIGA